jgi:hypothetical protein
LPAKNRKDINALSYTISDFFLGVTVNSGGRPLFDVNQNVLRKFQNQLLILNGIRERLSNLLSSLEQVIEADLFSREIDVSSYLLKGGHLRSAGAICGVLIERHLKNVCVNHDIKVTRKVPTISDLNDLLKNAEIIDVTQWRHIQYLGDIRNICVHDKDALPTPDQVKDLIDGTKKISSTIF